MSAHGTAMSEELYDQRDRWRHRRRGEKGQHGRPRYMILRDVDGAYQRDVGYVTRLNEADWKRSATWEAVSLDGQVRVTATTWKAACEQLEYRLLGPERAEQDRAAYAARHRDETAQRAMERLHEEARTNAILDRHPDMPHWDRLRKRQSLLPEHVTDMLEYLERVAMSTHAPTASHGYVIRRASGGAAGPFSTRETAEHYRQPGDEIVVMNEHGNVIDYGPQFSEGTGVLPGMSEPAV